MTRINAQSPVPYVVPTDARPHTSEDVKGTSQDFSSLLHAQSDSSLSSDDPAQSQQQPRAPAPIPHQQDTNATLEHLAACRAMSSNVAGRNARSTGSSVTALSPQDCSVGGDTADGAEMIGLTCAAERATVLRAEYIRCMNARRAASCWNGADDGPLECAPKDAAMADDQPVNIVVWIPVENLRTPLQSARPRRRRNPPSNEEHRRDEQGGDVDGTE